MGGPSLEEKVQGLSDLELAVLLSLIAGQHCIIETEKDALDTLAEELKLVRELKMMTAACCKYD